MEGQEQSSQGQDSRDDEATSAGARSADPATTRVFEVMSKDLVTATADEPVAQAAKRMADRAIATLPVVDEQGRLVGVLSDDDLLIEGARLHIPTVFGLLGDVGAWPPAVRRFERELKAAFASQVKDAMTTKFVSVAPDDTVEFAATTLHDHHLRALPVSDGGKLVGIISRTDVLRCIFGFSDQAPETT